MQSNNSHTRLIAGGVCQDRRLSVGRLTPGVKHTVEQSPRNSVGGGAANQARAQKRLAPQSRILLCAHLGDDPVGQDLRRQLVDDEGIEMSFEPLAEMPTSQSFIICEEQLGGRGTIVTVPGARCHPLPLQAIAAYMAAASAFCLCAPSCNEQIAPLLHLARRHRVPAYFALGSAQINKLGYGELHDQLRAGVELVVCNQSEAARVTGHRILRRQLEALLFGELARIAVVTCGAEGLWALERGEIRLRRQPPYRPPQPCVKDDTGAGDAAAAALIDCLVRGWALETALAAAARNGYEACIAMGVDRTCTRAQMDAFLAGVRRRAA